MRLSVLIAVILLAALLFLQEGTPTVKSWVGSFLSQYFSDRSRSEEEPQENLLLPDLVLFVPAELYIVSDQNTRKIRFDTSFINKGKGQLEIEGQSDPNRQKTKATQKITKTDKSVKHREIGEFVFHPGHEHWHIENYTVFEIWSLKGNREKGDLLATTNKMSFCLWDENAYDLNLENAPQSRKFIGCNNNIQGISVGWSDNYESSIEGQELDITPLIDGDYLIKSVVNPDRKIQESDYSNNEVIFYITINGNSLTIIQ